jgi:Ca-activated chloride channel family protein
MRDYNKALQAFSQALLTPDRGLQSKSHYNLGNTLYQHGEQQKNDDQKLSDWNNALQHYEETLKLEPDSQEAKENADYVRRKIEELKQRKQQQQEKKQQQQPGTKPSPPPEPSEAAKRAKAEADKAVRESKFRKALNIMADHLKVDATTSFYRDYIHRLQDINGIKRTDDSSP